MSDEQNVSGQGSSSEDPSVYKGVVTGGRPRACWSRGYFLPMLIVFIGLVYLLDQMRVLRASDVFHYFWPAIFVWFGFQGLFFDEGPGRFWGACLSVAGVLLVLNNLGYIHASWGIIWPLLVIFWGVWLLMQAMGIRQCRPRTRWGDRMRKDWRERMDQNSPDTKSDISVVFSTLKKRISTPHFQGGRMSAIFGEGDIDLSDADIEGNEAVIEAEAIFGAHKIRVPRGWEVQMRGTAIFGEFVDKTDHRPLPGTAAKRLVVLGQAVFGSVVVRD